MASITVPLVPQTYVGSLVPRVLGPATVTPGLNQIDVLLDQIPTLDYENKLNSITMEIRRQSDGFLISSVNWTGGRRVDTRHIPPVVNPPPRFGSDLRQYAGAVIVINVLIPRTMTAGGSATIS